MKSGISSNPQNRSIYRINLSRGLIIQSEWQSPARGVQDLKFQPARLHTHRTLPAISGWTAYSPWHMPLVPCWSEYTTCEARKQSNLYPSSMVNNGEQCTHSVCDMAESGNDAVLTLTTFTNHPKIIFMFGLNDGCTHWLKWYLLLISNTP